MRATKKNSVQRPQRKSQTTLQIATHSSKIQCNVLEEDLAGELERRKANEQREEQNRKRICESSEELRRLKSKLHAAQVNKERHQQLCDQLVILSSLLCYILDSDSDFNRYFLLSMGTFFFDLYTVDFQ